MEINTGIQEARPVPTAEPEAVPAPEIHACKKFTVTQVENGFCVDFNKTGYPHDNKTLVYQYEDLEDFITNIRGWYAARIATRK